MFLRQTGKTTGKKGSVCFFSLELRLGELPCGGDDGGGIRGILLMCEGLAWGHALNASDLAGTQHRRKCVPNQTS